MKGKGEYIHSSYIHESFLYSAYKFNGVSGSEGEGERGDVPENQQNCNFKTKFSTLGSHPQSGLNLACKCRPMVYSYVPDFIRIGIYC